MNFKPMFIGLMIFFSFNSFSNQWSPYALLGSLDQVDFEYRVLHTATKADVQFKVTNHNWFSSRVTIEDKSYFCADGSKESSQNTTGTVRGRRTLEFEAEEDICLGQGGAVSLQVSFRVKDRSGDTRDSVIIHF